MLLYKGVDLYMAFEITDIAKDLVKESMDLATESFAKDIEPSAEEVKLAAKELIDYTKELEINHKNNSLEKKDAMKSHDIETVYSFTKKMITDKEVFKKLM